MNLQEAQAITARIRGWVDRCPVDDILAAYEGQVWFALNYPTWGDWCDGELGGFKLPVPQRQSLVSELAGRGMSNTSIAEVAGVSEGTVRNDRRKSGSQNYEPDRVTGQDGKSYPAKRQPVTESEQIHATPEPMARKQAMEMLSDELELFQKIEKLEQACYLAQALAEGVGALGPFGDPAYVARLNRCSAALTDAQIAIMSTVVEEVAE